MDTAPDTSGDAPPDADALVDAGADATVDAMPDATADATDATVDVGPQGCHSGDFNFDDDFSQGLRPQYWSISYYPNADAGAAAFSYTTNTGELDFTKASAGNTMLKYIGATLDLTAAGGPVLGDFSMEVDFSKAMLGASPIDQIELHAEFGDNTIFYTVYSNEGGTLEFHVWDNTFRPQVATTVHAGRFKITRVGATLSGYAITATGDGGSDVETLLYSEQQPAKPQLNVVRFVAQNYNTDNDISVAFDNFHIQGACSGVDASVAQ